VNALSDAGYAVRVLDIVDPREPLREGQTFIRADVRDAAAMRAATEGCDVVVDNAALVPITKSSQAEFDDVNLNGCRTTLEAARSAGAYLVHISSTSIYGIPKQMPVTEQTPLEPFEIYGESKAKAERFVHEQREQGMVVSSLRSRSLLGKGRLGIFEPIFSRIRQNKAVPMFGTGSNVLQMCDARDFSAAMLACIERRANDDYNIGAAEYGTPREDFRALLERVGSTSRLVPIPVWAVRAVMQPFSLVGRSPFTAWHWHSGNATFYASLEKAERELGWKSQYSNVDALEHAYNEFTGGTLGGSAHTAPLPGILARLLRG
jgi:nucleoside-diphosphate-sugar epimerase